MYGMGLRMLLLLPLQRNGYGGVGLVCHITCHSFFLPLLKHTDQ